MLIQPRQVPRQRLPPSAPGLVGKSKAKTIGIRAFSGAPVGRGSGRRKGNEMCTCKPEMKRLGAMCPACLEEWERWNREQLRQIATLEAYADLSYAGALQALQEAA
ncbi:MAG TPA: hypothetical protein VEY08_14390 [Chloroflexia bacterium]|nr:hypothetical protein [Chloroflexia bacterium]